MVSDCAFGRQSKSKKLVSKEKEKEFGNTHYLIGFFVEVSRLLERLGAGTFGGSDGCWLLVVGIIRAKGKSRSKSLPLRMYSSIS